ncbi:restriction endonuclease subunit S [Acinetobacter guillouiae]|uniref:restriction endonuclease subunit S n=1 Tax=Acinetobacter guillouiae TaxID=106649 RepID=UPI003AF63154
MSFPKMRLDKVCRITMGQAPSGDSYNFDGNGLALIAGAGDFGKETPEPKKYTTAAGKRSEEGEIILCIRATIGDLNWSDKEYCLGRGVAGLFGHKDKLDQKYLWHWLKNVAPLLKSKGKGATFLQVTKEDICSLEIALPPLEEQRRIASILDQADELRQKRQQAIEKLDQLLQATFIDMFGDPVSNPKGWDLVRVGEVVDEFIGGKNIECPDESDSDYKILKVSAVTSKVYKPNESKFAPNTFEPNPLAIVEKGDLLFSRANTTELVAATAYVWETPQNIVLPDKLWKFSISDESKVNKLYLWDLFKNIEFRNELSKLSSGTSGSMKNISKGKLNELKMPLPPKELQDKFAEFSTKLWGQIKTFQQSSDSLDSLFNSLQNQAFNGTL